MKRYALVLVLLAGCGGGEFSSVATPEELKFDATSDSKEEVAQPESGHPDANQPEASDEAATDAGLEAAQPEAGEDVTQPEAGEDVTQPEAAPDSPTEAALEASQPETGTEAGQGDAKPDVVPEAGQLDAEAGSDAGEDAPVEAAPVCTDGDRQCEGATPKVCMGGDWVIGGFCNFSCGTDDCECHAPDGRYVPNTTSVYDTVTGTRWYPKLMGTFMADTANTGLCTANTKLPGLAQLATLPVQMEPITTACHRLDDDYFPSDFTQYPCIWSGESPAPNTNWAYYPDLGVMLVTPESTMCWVICTNL